MKGRIGLLVLVALFAGGCLNETVLGKPAGYRPPIGTNPGNVAKQPMPTASEGRQLATFAAGQFWDVEYKFREIPGVTATAAGFTGGLVKDPSYEEVGTQTTGHAEAVLVEFDPKKVSYDYLLREFFRIHDPTTLNQQGDFKGNHYRSAIFYHSPEQREAAAAMVLKLSNDTGKRIVTFVAPAEPFYLAPPEHQQRHEKQGVLPTPTDDWRN